MKTYIFLKMKFCVDIMIFNKWSVSIFEFKIKIYEHLLSKISNTIFQNGWLASEKRAFYKLSSCLKSTLGVIKKKATHCWSSLKRSYYVIENVVYRIRQIFCIGKNPAMIRYADVILWGNCFKKVSVEAPIFFK